MASDLDGLLGVILVAFVFFKATSSEYTPLNCSSVLANEKNYRIKQEVNWQKVYNTCYDNGVELTTNTVENGKEYDLLLEFLRCVVSEENLPTTGTQYLWVGASGVAKKDTYVSYYSGYYRRIPGKLHKCYFMRGLALHDVQDNPCFYFSYNKCEPYKS